MKKLAVAFLFAFSLPAFSSQLNLAVVQFPEIKTVAQLDQALAGTNLAEMTNSNRTMTKASYLKGGYVIFSQSFPAAGHFKSITRLSNNRADVDGTFGNGKIHVTISLSEGVAAGLRRFSSRMFQGTSDLKAGQPRVVSVRQIAEKVRQVSRGDVSMAETISCTAIIAQISE